MRTRFRAQGCGHYDGPSAYLATYFLAVAARCGPRLMISTGGFPRISSFWIASLPVRHIRPELYSRMPSKPTHLEIEVKVRVTDLSGLIHRLRRLGAFPRRRVLERNTLFDTPDSALRLSGRMLRLRMETPARSRFSSAGPLRTVLTCKAPRRAGQGTKRRSELLYKAKQEREAVISQIASQPWVKILRSLGFRPGLRYEKYRTHFRLGQVHLDLDETPIGTFLEIEGAPHLIDRISRRLGYSRSDHLRETYWDLFTAECRRRGVFPRNMLFHA